MTEAAGAIAVLHVQDHVVIWARTWGNAVRDSIEIQLMTNFPGDDVVCTGSVPADAESSHDVATGVVERKAAAKHNDAADRFPNHWIVRLTLFVRVAGKDRLWIRRSAGGEAKEALAGGGGEVQVRRGEGEVIETQSVRGARFFRGNNPTAWPLRAAIGTAENYLANYSITINDHCPMVVTKAAIC